MKKNVDSTAESINAFLEFMSRNGMNTTTQRRAIAEAFFQYPGHHSLEDFYHHVQERDPSIGQTTVYRTLKLLCEAGLATEIHFKDGIARYELARPNGHHDHMVCLSCGRIVEIFDSRIEALQREIAQAHGFILSGHVHNLFGVCPDCHSQENAR